MPRLGGKDWYLGVAAPGETVALDHVAAFHIPGDRIVKLHVGTWHAGPHFTHEEAMFLNLENADTNSRDFGETILPAEFLIAPNAEACSAMSPGLRRATLEGPLLSKDWISGRSGPESD